MRGSGRRVLAGAVVAGLAVAAVSGCGSSSTSGGTTTSVTRTTPVAHTVNAAAAAPALTRRHLLARVDRLCAQESATIAPILRKLNAPGVRPDSAALTDGLMAAARTLEFGLAGLHPSARDSDAFRRYRQSVTRSNAFSEQFAAKHGAAGRPPTQAEIDTGDDIAILQQADAAVLGARRCTFPSTQLEMHRRSG